MKKSDIISELFSILKNKTAEERLLAILEINNNTYEFEDEYLREVSNEEILNELEKIIMVVVKPKVVPNDSEATLLLLLDFCEKLSTIDYTTFKSELFKYNLNLFKNNLKLSKQLKATIASSILLFFLAFSIYKQIDEGLKDDNSNTNNLATNTISLAATENIKKPELPKLKDEALELEWQKFVFATPPVEPTEPTVEPTEVPQDEREQKTPEIHKPVLEYDDLEEYEIPYTPTDPNKKDHEEEVPTSPIPVESAPKTDSYEILSSIVNPNQNAAELITVDEKIQYILDRYNLSLEEFNVVKSIVMAEAMYDSYDDGYAVINTMYNRTLSKDKNNFVNYYYGKGAGRSLYYQAIAPNQFIVYQNGRYEKYLSKNDGPVYDAIIDFLTTEVVKHSYLSFLSAETNMTRSYEQFDTQGNKYFEELVESDLIVVEDNTNSRS